MRPYSNGVVYCYEPGTNGAFCGYYSAGDKLRVALEGGVVKYYLISGANTTLMYTATHAPSYPMSADAAIYDNGGTVTNAVISGNLSGGGGTQINWLVTDHLGTPRMIFDETGRLDKVKRHDYLPFGEELFAGTGGRTAALGYAPGDGVRQQFTLKERDIETGLDYFEARYYSPNQGRFTSPDDFNGGPDEYYDFNANENPTFYGDLTDPQSLNKYQYAYNNPLLYIDPDGHQGVREWFRNTAKAAGAAIVETVEGAASAYGEDSGVGGTTGSQNRVGRAVGHGLALVQGAGEVYLGVQAMAGGGTEAVLTAPACASGAGCAAPAVGAATAVGGAALATHGTITLGRAFNNIFNKNTSAQQSSGLGRSATTKTSGTQGQKTTTTVSDPAGSTTYKTTPGRTGGQSTTINQKGCTRKRQVRETGGAAPEPRFQHATRSCPL